MLLPDVTARHREPELLDSGDVEPDRHAQALSALARVNALSLTAGRVWRRVREAARDGAPVRVLDVACGGGDVVVELLLRARRAGVTLAADACDASPIALDQTRRLARRRGVAVGLHELDVRESPLPGPYDVVCSSLFLHHLDEPDAIRLLESMAAVTRATLLVQDLLRTRLGYALAWTAMRILTRSAVARVDGSRSVRAAYTLPEAETLGRRAGLRGARVRRCWPERFELEWTRA